MPRSNSIPILLLTGFLGAGKTSLLNNLLRNNQGFKIGVIVNDFGKINIDSMLVSAQTDAALELSNGCICCSLEGESLDDAIGQLAHQGSRLDYIIIEASGLAEPRELATMLRLQKNNYAHFDALINIVDGANFKKNNLAAKNALQDLSVADLIIINKVDLIDAKELADIKRSIRLVAAKSRLLEASHGQIDFRLLLDFKEKASEQLGLAQPTEHDHQHLHETFQAVDLSTDQPLDPQKFEAWAENLSEDIFRSKGIIFFGAKGVHQKFIFQAVGGRWSLKLDEWDFNQEPRTELIVIGINFDQKKMEKQLQTLIDDQPDDISAATIMDIFKYK